MEKNVATINISLKTLIRECSNNKRDNDSLYFDFLYSNRENIHSIFKYKKFNDDFIDTLACYNDLNCVIGIIRPSYAEFLIKLTELLNVEVDVVVDDNLLDKKLRERLAILQNIKTEAQLASEFPLIYKDLIEGRKFIDSVECYEEDSEVYKKQRDYYYSCALKRRLDRFISTQSELYKRFINKREELKQLQEGESYNAYIREYFNIDKIALLVVDGYLKVCENNTNTNVINTYLDLVTKYINSSYNKDVFITNDNGEIINYNNIVTRYNMIRNKLNNNSNIVDWIIIPEGKDYSRVSKKSTSKDRVTLLNYEEINRLTALGERKQKFYEGTSYLVKAIGLMRYSGYIAYIYPNGEVILDTKYVKDHPKSATGNAIYNLKVGDFEVLSKLDKTTLRNNPRVHRIMHSGNWERRVNNIINRDGSESDKIASIELVKKLKKK
jgi:hypothetical protein